MQVAERLEEQATPFLSFEGPSGVKVDLPKLIGSRLLLQANSGGGKSYALRYVLEQTHGKIQQIVLDSEGEFASLREKFDYVLVGREGDLPIEVKAAKLLCRRLVELGASAVLDLYELSLADRKRFVRLFLDELMHLPKNLWRPLLVVIDEAHVFCPEKGAGEAESADAVKTLCTQGRKRGFCAVLATQRIAKLHKDAAAELNNKLIGRTGLDVDVKRAGDELGFDQNARKDLRWLQPGEFFAFGPAIALEVVRVRIGTAITTHPKAGEIAPPVPPPRGAIKGLLAQLEGISKKAEEEIRDLAAAQARIAELERQVRSRPAPPVDQTALENSRQQNAELSRRLTEAQKEIEERDRRLRNMTKNIEKAVATLGGSVQSAPSPSRETVDMGPSIAVGEKPNTPRPTRVVPAAPPPSTPAQPVEGAPDWLGKGHMSILNALAQFEALGVSAPERRHVAALAGYVATGGSFKTYLSRLSAGGLITYEGSKVSFTQDGRALTPPPDHVATLEEYHEAWLRLLPGTPHRNILQPLIEMHPEGTTREELGERTGYTATGGSFKTYLSRLSSMGLVRYDGQQVFASDLLFPEGLH